MTAPALNAEVLISSANDCHNGEVGVVTGWGLDGAMVIVRVRDCVHTYSPSRLRRVPERDTIPAPVES